MKFGFAGPFGEPKVFEALFGKRVPSWEMRMARGVETKFQRIEDAPVAAQEIIKGSWGDRYPGAFTLVESPTSQTPVTIYDVPDQKDSDLVLERLGFWDLEHTGWFVRKNLNVRVGNQELTLVTHAIADESKLIGAPQFPRKEEGYWPLVEEMKGKLVAEFPQAPRGPEDIHHGPGSEKPFNHYFSWGRRR